MQVSQTGVDLDLLLSEKVCPDFFAENSDMTVRETGRRYGESVTVSCDTGHYIHQGEAGEDREYTALCLDTGIWDEELDCESKCIEYKNLS